MITVTIARTQLILAAAFCVTAGLQAGNAFAALAAGRTPLWGAMGCCAGLLAAYYSVREGIARARGDFPPRF